MKYQTMTSNQTSADEHQSAVLAGIGHAITEYAPLPMATMEGASHIVRYVNPAFCRLLGKLAEDIVGRPFAELVSDNGGCLKQLDRVYHTGESASHTEKDHAELRTIFWSYSMWPVMVDECAVGVMVQVTETATLHEQTVAMNEELMLGSVRQHELTETSERLNAQLRREIAERTKIQQTLSEKVRLLDLSNDAIVVLDVEHRIQFWNHGAEELYGWSREEALGKMSHALLHSTFSKPFEEIREELYRTNRWTGELTHTKRNGQRITVLVRKVLDRDDHGKAVAILESMTDITERTKVEEALRRAQALLSDRASHLEELVAERTSELTATNKQMETFVYSIAHDLRAPLHSMQGFSELLVGDAGTTLSEAGRDFARRIDKSAQFMDALLSDLVAFSRISQRHVELTSVSLNTAIASVLSRLESDIKAKNARVESSGPRLSVLAHEPTLAQVLFNLTSNALKFVVAGVPPLVRLRSEERAEFVRVWVEDNGPGIAPQYQDQIFRLFARLEGEKYPGTGLGLTIVQKGLERMGGRVGVESKPGQGSRFWFELRKA
jgi:PAS domain S-box-containing protein